MTFIFKLFFLISVTFYAHARELNVYLKVNDTQLTKAIQAFNGYLKGQGVFSKYDITPFIDHHPLHITLYLASFPATHLKKVQDELSKTAKKWHPFTIKTTQIVITSGNYVMLDVDHHMPVSGPRPLLQKLSDELTLGLSDLRDFQAKIPEWAEKIPAKRKAFYLYGSPNVFFEYSPHFTLMAKKFTDPVQEQAFHMELEQLIASYSFAEYAIKADTLGIGYVDEFGQITEELAQYPLS